MKYILFVIFLAGTFSSCEKVLNNEVVNFDRKWVKEEPFSFSDISGIIRNDIAWIQLDSLFHVVNLQNGESIRTVSSGQGRSLLGSRATALNKIRNFLFREPNSYTYENLSMKKIICVLC